jgi:SAM-dependent methyltransferase
MDQDRRRRWDHRHRSDDTIGAPSPFVAHALDILADEATTAPTSRRALDVACGRGRHALLLADHGYDVDAVDYALPALTTLKHAAAARGLTIRCLATDVTTWPLPSAHYALVLVINFLERPLLDALRSAVAPGGALLCETYQRDERVGATPALRPDFLLAPGELDEACRGWRILARHEDTATHDGRVVARAGILAQRPLASSPTDTPTAAH